MIEKIVRKEIELQKGVKLYSVPDARMSDEELREALHNDWDFANWEEPTAEMCQDMDIEPGIKTLILGGFDEFCFCPKEKIFPNVVELHICRNVSCIIIDPKAFPNIRKVTSESPYFLDSDMLVRLPDDIADMVMCDEISKQDAANMNRGILENVFCRRPDEVVDLNGIQEISGNCSFYGCETENIINTDSVTDCWLGSFYCFKPFNPNNKWNIEDKYKEDYMIGTILVMPYIEPGKDDKKTKYIFPDKKVTAIAKDDVGLSFTRRFTMPDDMFYPGASVSSCCMVFTLGQPHVNADDSVTKTFLGYFKNDCHTKRKNGGRVEMYDKNGKSMWKETKEKWLSLYKNKEVEPGLSATATLGEEDEWLCEAYMDADVSKLKKNDFLKSINNFLGSKTTYGNVLDVVNLVNTLKDNKEDIELTDTKTWKPFKVKDIFKNIEKGKCANASALADGDDIAYIGAKWKDNGVMKFCDKESNTDIISTGNCIAMIGQGQGSAGYAMYMENDFIGATSLNLGYADWINMFTGLFVSAVLCLEYDKYSFGRSWTGNRLLETVVYLPAIKNREVYIPDFEYMEKYMKNILF